MLLPTAEAIKPEMAVATVGEVVRGKLFLESFREIDYYSGDCD